jgi:hypothetical protein
LFSCQPITNPNPQPFGTLNSGDAGRQFWAQQSRVCSFESETTHGGEPNIDGRRGEVFLFKEESISEHNGAIESQPRF